jgi:hypothetical protein
LDGFLSPRQPDEKYPARNRDDGADLYAKIGETGNFRDDATRHVRRYRPEQALEDKGHPKSCEEIIHF